jgi:DNA (cytosine-5)-methyltransferase 1
MKHYGDITKISGYDVPVVDVITGGSPCQDLSVAGKRAGLAGERSGLFMDQIRIVKEMRFRDKSAGRTAGLCRCRYMVWENVPGAFSSGTPRGADFQAVLEEIVKVVRAEAPAVPIPDGGWPYAGCLSGVGDDGCPFSIAWRLHDAQFWGVPQRRKRIALVADFGGLSAPEILFERQGLRGDPAESGAAGKGAAARAEDGAGSAISFQERAGKPGGAKGS